MEKLSVRHAKQYAELAGGYLDEMVGEIRISRALPRPAGQLWSYYRVTDGKLTQGSGATAYDGPCEWVGVDRTNCVGPIRYCLAGKIGGEMILVPAECGASLEVWRAARETAREIEGRAPSRDRIAVDDAVRALFCDESSGDLVRADNGVFVRQSGWIWAEMSYGRESDLIICYDANSGDVAERSFSIPAGSWVCEDCGRRFIGEMVAHRCRQCAERGGYTGARCACGNWATESGRCPGCEEQILGVTSTDYERQPEMVFPRIRRGVRLLGVPMSAAVGVEMETTYRDARLRYLYGDERVGRKVGHKRDGSINPGREVEAEGEEDGDMVGGLEYVTSPLFGGLEPTIEAWSSILRGGRAGKWGANTSCGLHFHIDARRAGAGRVARMCRLWWKFESSIMRLQPKSRDSARGSSDAGRYCKRLDRSERSSVLLEEMAGDEDLAEQYLASWWYRGVGVNEFRHLSPVGTGEARATWGGDRYSGARYSTINLCSYYGKHKTVEIRAGAGTTRASRILPWVALGLRLWDIAGDEDFEQVQWSDVVSAGELSAWSKAREVELYGHVV